MDLKKTLTNPWVIGAGLGIGVLFLFAGSGGGNSGGNNAAASASAFATANAAATSQYNSSIAARVALGQAAYQNSGQIAGYYSSLLSNLQAIQGQVQVGLAQSNAGAVSNIVTANSILAYDMSNNAGRVQQTGIATIGQISNTGTNAVASQRIAQDAAGANIANSISNGIVGLAYAATKAAGIGAKG